jgi:hypothetical protein
LSELTLEAFETIEIAGKLIDGRYFLGAQGRRQEGPGGSRHDQDYCSYKAEISADPIGKIHRAFPCTFPPS